MLIINFVCISKRLMPHWLCILRPSNIQVLRYLDKGYCMKVLYFLYGPPQRSSKHLPDCLSLIFTTSLWRRKQKYSAHYYLLRDSVKLKKVAVSIGRVLITWESLIRSASQVSKQFVTMTSYMPSRAKDSVFFLLNTFQLITGILIFYILI